MPASRVTVARTWGETIDPELPAVYVTNDNIETVWPKIRAERQEELLRDGFVLSLDPPPDYAPAAVPTETITDLAGNRVEVALHPDEIRNGTPAPAPTEAAAPASPVRESRRHRPAQE